jgi:nucleotide-binding universal stress UspA family protein
METNFVTVAIHTYDRAQLLKTLLEREGIEAHLHSVNPAQSEAAAGVRVRINENQLAHALQVIEEMEYAYRTGADVLTKPKVPEILIPVDFSDYSIRACDFGFKMAERLRARVTLLHAYYSPVFSIAQLTETLSYDIYENEAIKQIVKKAEGDIQNLANLLKRKMQKGELPSVAFVSELREGVPEDAILSYAKEREPALVVMGTRGKDQKEADLIGSVTAEIIDRSRVPVLAVPENVLLSELETVQQVAFACGFDQKDLLAFDKMMQFLKPFQIKVYLTYIQQRRDKNFNEEQVSVIKDYFARNYPGLEFEYLAIREDDLLGGLQAFIQAKKIGLLVLNSHKRNIFTHLFNPSVAHKMIFHTDTPMLVFHS